MNEWTASIKTTAAERLSEIDTTGIEPALACLLDEMAHGMMLATAHGRLLHANHAARAELAIAQALLVRQDHLHAGTPADDQALHQQLQRVAGGGPRALLTLRGGTSRALSVAVVPIRSASDRVALVLERPAVCDTAMLGDFARSQGLTPTESHVLGILCHGYSAPEVAKQLRVAVSTIRSHVRSLCGKTGSAGVRDLVARVSVLPPVAPHQTMAIH